MASIPCTTAATHSCFASKSFSSSTFSVKLNTQFLGTRNRLGRVRPFGLGPSNGSRAKCWFKFGKNGIDAEGAGIYGSQSRDDFDKDDVEQVFTLSPFTSFSYLIWVCVNVGELLLVIN